MSEIHKQYTTTDSKGILEMLYFIPIRIEVAGNMNEPETVNFSQQSPELTTAVAIVFRE